MLNEYFKNFSRDPLLLFAMFGVLIFILYYSLEGNYKPSIKLSNEVRVQLLSDYKAITGRKVTPQLIARLEKNYIADELLFREAINAGMHLIDPTTRSSLIEKMRFRISALIPEPSDAELIDYYAQNIQRYYTENSLSFEHVFFVKLPINADTVIAKLQSGESVIGDKFVHGNQFSDLSEGMLRGIFGESFLTELQALDSNQWVGPFLSNHGLHYIRLQKLTPPQPIQFLLAKNLVANDLMQLRIDQAVESKIQTLAARYEITIEP